MDPARCFFGPFAVGPLELQFNWQRVDCVDGSYWLRGVKTLKQNFNRLSILWPNVVGLHSFDPIFFVDGWKSTDLGLSPFPWKTRKRSTDLAEPVFQRDLGRSLSNPSPFNYWDYIYAWVQSTGLKVRPRASPLVKHINPFTLISLSFFFFFLSLSFLFGIILCCISGWAFKHIKAQASPFNNQAINRTK